MSWALLSLCVAAFTMVAVLVSAFLSVLQPSLDRLARLMAPHNRVRLWLTVAIWPAAVAATTVVVSFLPELGLGWGHHLTEGPHHPHLSTEHTRAAIGFVLVAITVVTILRVLIGGQKLIRTLALSEATSRTLVEASERHGEVFVFDEDQPIAFVLGAWRARIHVSKGLLALGPEVALPVLAHERAHAQRRDFLWRTLSPVICGGHLPSMGAAIRNRICTAQEMAADFQAADELPQGRVMIAQAILTIAHYARTASTVAFNDGNLKARVLALLEPATARPRWPLHVFAASWLLMPLTLLLMHDIIHHGLETLLSALV